ncbi:MAG: class I SAM-dependent methyltransferase [Phycisphaerales bacterium]
MPTKRPKPCPLTAASADRHLLYRHAVQNPEAEVEFASRVYRDLRGRQALHLREDFAATAEVAAAWVASGKDRTCVGVDLHRPTLRWAEKHVASRLTPDQRARLSLVCADVLDLRAGGAPRPDLILALNFSYWVFTDRPTLVRYFRQARAALAGRGLLVLDFMGGGDAHLEVSDRTRCWMPRDRRTGIGGPYTYVWEHAMFDPVSARTTCHIHFEFPDGPPMKRAFTYHWRLWGVAELRDCLVAAGFGRTRVFWEGEDAKGGGDGVFRERARGTADRSYVGYFVCER